MDGQATDRFVWTGDHWEKITPGKVIEYSGPMTVEQFDEMVEQMFGNDPQVKPLTNQIRQILYPENLLIL